MRLFKGVVITLGSVLTATQLWAHTFDNMAPAQSTNFSQTSLSLSNSRTEYVRRAGDKFSLDRTIIGADFSTMVLPEIAVFGQGGSIVRSKFADNGAQSGDGYTVGLGVKTEAYRSGRISTVPYTQFNYVTEKINTGDVKSEIDIYEWSVGTTVAFYQKNLAYPYIGLEVLPINVGKAKHENEDQNSNHYSLTSELTPDSTKTTYFNRDDVFCLRVGGVSKIDEFAVRAEVALIAETTFSVAAGFEF